MGDALGVLFGASALRSKGTHINKIMMELALLLAPSGNALDALHIWSMDNAMADMLSRMESDAGVPAEMQQVSRTAWPETWWWQIVTDHL